jgi:hypothetical protein
MKVLGFVTVMAGVSTWASIYFVTNIQGRFGLVVLGFVLMCIGSTILESRKHPAN